MILCLAVIGRLINDSINYGIQFKIVAAKKSTWRTCTVIQKLIKNCWPSDQQWRRVTPGSFLLLLPLIPMRHLPRQLIF